MFKKIFQPVALLAAVVFIVGCGSSEEKLYDVSGAVTFEGKPVQKGVIHFEPDAFKGNKGVAGFANIEDGKFTTAVKGKGVKGGPYIIRINGFDGKVGPEAPFGTALFPEYTDKHELKNENQTLDIDVKKKR